jgi:hypothetical protein
MPTKVREPGHVAQYFCSIKNGNVRRHGHVICADEPAWYLLELFDWFGETSNVQWLVRIEDIARGAIAGKAIRGTVFPLFPLMVNYL